MVAESRPFEVFVKPKHPRFNWTTLNEAKHEQALINLTIHEERVRNTRKQKGLVSLKGHNNRVRFGSLPKRDRPKAEVQLTRLINRHIQRTGSHPSHMKLISLMANAVFIVKHVQSGNYRRWVARNRNYRRMADGLDKAEARAGTPAEQPTSPKRKTSWRGLTGI